MWPFLGLSLSFMISILLKSTMAFILMFGHDDVCPIFYSLFIEVWTSLVAEMVKNPPATRETWVWSLGWDDPLENGTATHSSILAWRIPRTIQSMESQRDRHYWVTFTFTSFWVYEAATEAWASLSMFHFSGVSSWSYHGDTMISVGSGRPLTFRWEFRSCLCPSLVMWS